MSDAIRELLTMLTYARPAGSATERAFVHRWIMPLGAYADAYGNLHVRIDRVPDDVDTPHVLWSAHTDTVAGREGRPTLHVDARIAQLSRRSRRRGFACLGADDTVGCWLLIHMIRSRVPGHYVFHGAEECGGIGSSDLAWSESDWLRTFDAAIAFDRRGTTDVITHQAGGRTASDTFAWSLATVLNAADPTFSYAPSSMGIFTDTANYADLIPECTNVSVGYDREHRANETIDLAHADALRIALLTIDLTHLVIDRTPGDDDDDRRSWGMPIWAHDPIVSGALADAAAVRDYDVDTGDDTSRYGDRDPGRPSPDVDRSIYLTDDYAAVMHALWCDDCDRAPDDCVCDSLYRTSRRGEPRAPEV